jgi:hypothetical protein
MSKLKSSPKLMLIAYVNIMKELKSRNMEFQYKPEHERSYKVILKCIYATEN